MGAPTSSRLYAALSDCAASFGDVRQDLERDRAYLRADALAAAWTTHYAGAFARFESELTSSYSAQPKVGDTLLPIAISHHNLHRLVEVLALELGNRPLEDTRVEERLSDLDAMVERLGQLLTTLSERPTSLAGT